MYGIGYDEPKFKVGDRVRAVKSGWGDGGSYHCAAIGEENVIIDDANDMGRFEGEKWFYNPDEIELVHEKPVQAPKFKAGQRVLVVDAQGGGAVGDIATVTNVEPRSIGERSDCDMLDGPSRGARMLYEHRLAPAFFPGDKVRVTEHSGYFGVGDIGEVETQKDATVFVKHGHYSRVGLPIDADALEMVEAAGDEPRPKFKAGDVVVYADGQAGGGGWDFERDLTLPPGTGQQLASALSFERSREDAALGIIHHCIVARVVDGRPRPSNVPYVHDNAAAATTEAERLAKNNPGQEFAVYQRVAGRMAEVSYSVKEVA